MKPLDYVLIAAVVVIIGLALFFTIRNVKRGKNCGGDCPNCRRCIKAEKREAYERKEPEKTKK